MGIVLFVLSIGSMSELLCSAAWLVKHWHPQVVHFRYAVVSMMGAQRGAVAHLGGPCCHRAAIRHRLSFSSAGGD